jgi:hypothetical protein
MASPKIEGSGSVFLWKVEYGVRVIGAHLQDINHNEIIKNLFLNYHRP